MCAENWWIISCLLHYHSTAFPQQGEWCCPKQPTKHVWVLGFIYSPRSLLAVEVCKQWCMWSAGCWCSHRGPGRSGRRQAGIDAPPSLALSCKLAQWEMTLTRWCKCLDETHFLFNAADNKLLGGTGSLKLLFWLTWHVDSHSSPMQGSSAVLANTQSATKVQPGMTQLH